ncbi:anion exchange protein 4 [Colius striatus]|uniref:anion exchange protein 4 n=1 Tax=Colius striatus TaxID=57412 RepID=UPI002B1DC0D3|nr:anion exchange protein 4 [Colius striatus]
MARAQRTGWPPLGLLPRVLGPQGPRPPRQLSRKRSRHRCRSRRGAESSRTQPGPSAPPALLQPPRTRPAALPAALPAAPGPALGPAAPAPRSPVPLGSSLRSSPEATPPPSFSGLPPSSGAVAGTGAPLPALCSTSLCSSAGPGPAAAAAAEHTAGRGHGQARGADPARDRFSRVPVPSTLHPGPWPRCQCPGPAPLVPRARRWGRASPLLPTRIRTRRQQCVDQHRPPVHSLRAHTSRPVPSRPVPAPLRSAPLRQPLSSSAAPRRVEGCGWRGGAGQALQVTDTNSQPRPEGSNPEAHSQAFGCNIFPSSVAPAAKRAVAVLQQEDWGGGTCPLLFVQLNQLLSTPAGPVWRETARWIKFEEKVEEGGERWSTPHVPALPLHSLFQLRTCLQKGTMLLDLDASTFKEIIEKVLSEQTGDAELQPELGERLAALLLCQPQHQPTKTPLRLLTELCRAPCRGRDRACPEPRAQLSETPLQEQLRNRFKKKVPSGTEAAHIAVGEVEFLEKPFAAFIRLRQAVALGSLAEVALPSKFLFILLGPRAKAKAYQDIGRAMATLLTDELFQRVARRAEDREDLIAGIEAFLDELTVLPPGKWDPSARIPPLSCLSSPHRSILLTPLALESCSLKLLSLALLCHRTAAQPPDQQPHSNGETAAAGDRAGSGHLRLGEELERTGRLFGGLLQDIRRKAPWYGSDFRDALHPQCLSAVLYIYLATVTNAITFGGMLGDATDNMQGVLESFLGTAFTGSIFCLFSGQPLTILSSTGPMLVFERLLFSFSQDHGLEYLEFRLWIGLWVAFFGVVLVATEASHLVRYFTRFTEEGFCALISLIFIYDSLKKMLNLADTFPINWQYRLDNITSYSCVCNLSSAGHSSAGNDTLLPSPLYSWQPPTAPAGLSRTQCLAQGGQLLGTSCQYVPDVTLISFLLFGGTFFSCTALKHFRSSRYFPARVRKLVSDFAVIVAILASCTIDTILGLETPKLLVPSELKPTNPARGWIVFPFGANPWWVCLVSAVPAVLVTILIFMDQQITAVILNRREYKLQKGAGFHLDLLCISLLMVTTSATGLPWYVSATVISLAHMESLRKESATSAPGEHPEFLGIREQRLTGLAVFVLTGASVFMAPVLKHIPMPVLYGVFLHMGVAALNSIQLTGRVQLLLMPAKHQPDLTYLRHVPLRRVHLFTIIQLLCLALLWVVKSTVAAIIFPLMLLALVGIRKGLECIFSLHDLSWLDSLLPESAGKEAEGKLPGKLTEEEGTGEEVGDVLGALLFPGCPRGHHGGAAQRGRGWGRAGSAVGPSPCPLSSQLELMHRQGPEINISVN